MNDNKPTSVNKLDALNQARHARNQAREQPDKKEATDQAGEEEVAVEEATIKQDPAEIGTPVEKGGDNNISIILTTWVKAGQQLAELMADRDANGIDVLSKDLGAITFEGYKEPYADKGTHVPPNGENPLTKTLTKQFTGDLPEDAIEAVIGNSIGLAGRTPVWLPYLGVWATVAAPSPILYSSYWYKLQQLIDEEAISTYGVAYATQVAPFAMSIFELVSKHITAVNVKGANVSDIINPDTLKMPDLELLIMAMLSSRYSTGYEVDVKCLKCSHEDTFNYNLARTVKYNLPDELNNHPVALCSKDTKVDVKDMEEYQALVAELSSKEAVLSPTLTATFRPPSLAGYLESSHAQTQRISEAMETIMVEIDNDDTLAQRITDSLKITYLANHTSKITVANLEDPDNPGYIRSGVGLLKAYESLGADLEIQNTAIEQAKQWAGDVFGMSVMPTYNCTACIIAEQADEKVENTLTEDFLGYTPIDVFGFFSIAMMKQFVA